MLIHAVVELKEAEFMLRIIGDEKEKRSGVIRMVLFQVSYYM